MPEKYTLPTDTATDCCIIACLYTNYIRPVIGIALIIVIQPGSNNGDIIVSKITEGNGLGALRQRLDQEGASLKVLCNGSVSLIADIPFDFDEPHKGGRK